VHPAAPHGGGGGGGGLRGAVTPCSEPAGN